MVRRGLSLAGLRWAFTTFHGANWHPLTWLSHMLDATLFGPGPAGPHFVNLLLHAANTLLVFRLLRLATGALWRSLLVAAVFAAHPLHVESVAWAAERKDLLAAFFGLLALLAWRRYAARPRPSSYMAALSLLAAGLMAKPMLVTLPFVLLLLDVWPLGRLRWERPNTAPPLDPPLRKGEGGRLLLEKIPFLLLAAASSAVTWIAQTTTAALMPVPFPARAANALVSWVRYIAKAAWPADLSVFYPHPLRIGPAWQWLGAAGTLLLVTALAIAGLRRRPWAAAGWLWFAGMLVPVIGLVQAGGQAMADRYMYLPLLGLAVPFAWLLAEMAERYRGLKPLLPAAAAAAVLALGAAASAQVAFWKDERLLFARAAEVTSGNAEAHVHLGEYYESRGDPGRALEHYREAVRFSPGDPTALNNLGVLLARQGRRAEAEPLFRAAIAADPGSGVAHANLARQLARRGLAAEAQRHFGEAVRLNPRDAEANLELAKLLLTEGRNAEASAPLARAEGLYRERLEGSPADADAHLNLGAVQAWQGKDEEAAAHFAEAARLEPGWDEARRNLAAVMERIGRRREAAGAATPPSRRDSPLRPRP